MSTTGDTTMGKISFNVIFFILNFILFVALVSLQYGFFMARNSINVTEMCDKLVAMEVEKRNIIPTTAPLGKEGVVAVKECKNTPIYNWNEDWDGRQQLALKHGLIKPDSLMRRIWLVRHANYYTEGEKRGQLTELGKKQAEYTGKRLKEMGIGFDAFVTSTSKRAVATSEIILKHLPKMNVEKSDLLKEGFPTFPDPPFPFHVTRDKSFEEDGVRIEQAFRKYIHRPEVSQRHTQVNEIIVAHGNIIGYFALRGLQVATERWLKLQVIQGSISMFEVTSDGHVNVRMMGDMGHIPLSDWTG